jgi:dihydroorotase
VHAEDDARLQERKALARSVGDHPEWRDVETALRATWRVLALARRFGRPVHVLHVTTGDELGVVAECRDVATCETSPQHLTFAAPEIYERLGTRAQMNPPIRDARHRDALWEGVRTGVIDLIATDHAPHTLDEKARAYPDSPSGMPGVQTLVPVMLDHVAHGRLSLERLVDLVCAGPARVWNLASKGRIALGYDADLTLVDLDAKRTIRDQDMASRCAWTPFDGMDVTGWPIATIVRGHVAMRDGALTADACGKPARFIDTLAPRDPAA